MACKESCPRVLLCLAILFAVSRAQVPPETSCIFTVDQCSCSRAFQGSGSKCVRLAGDSSEGMCEFDTCQPGFTCDCAGDFTCSRKSCLVWGPENDIIRTSGPFKCVRSQKPCIILEEETSAETESVPEPPTSTVAPPLAPAPTKTTPPPAPPNAAATIPPTSETTVAPPLTTAEVTAPPQPVTTTVSTTTTVTTTTEYLKPICIGVKCPPCFVPSEDCDTCIPDSSMSHTEARQCQLCTSGGDSFCPAGTKCCEENSKCKGTQLPARGISLDTLTFVCSDSCDSDCDSTTADTCMRYSRNSVTYPVPGTTDSADTQLKLCQN